MNTNQPTGESSYRLRIYLKSAFSGELMSLKAVCNVQSFFPNCFRHGKSTKVDQSLEYVKSVSRAPTLPAAALPGEVGGGEGTEHGTARQKHEPSLPPPSPVLSRPLPRPTPSLPPSQTSGAGAAIT